MEIPETSKRPRLPKESSPRPPWRWAVAGAALLLLVALLQFLRQGATRHSLVDAEASRSGSADGDRKNPWDRRIRHGSNSPAATATPEEIVAGKVSQFARSRRDIVNALARKHKVTVPDDVARFFEAVEAGQWEELNALFQTISERHKSDPRPPDLAVLWPPILETLGVAESAHDWPAQKLLDYGNSILDPLRPGMVYVGGTDPGRFIPTLLNETGEGPSHIVLTQNALADRSYLDYIGFLHGDAMGTLTGADSDRAFSEYLADAKKRMEHDQQFPNEPRQLRPDEDVRVVDGKVQVSGQVAVMSINERLLQAILQKNPKMSFAMEESVPFKSMMADAAPLGAILELRVRDEQNTLTPERATQSIDSWRATAQQLLADPQAIASEEVRKTYSKMASSQGGLFQENHLPAQAEEAYRIAVDICPCSPEAVFRLVSLLADQGRVQDALPVAEAAARIVGNNQQQFRTLVAELNRLSGR